MSKSKSKNNSQDLQEENDRLLRELSDACLQIVDMQTAYKKMYDQSKILEETLIFHLTQKRWASPGRTIQEAKKIVTDLISEGLAESAHEWARPFDEEAFDD